MAFLINNLDEMDIDAYVVIDGIKKPASSEGSKIRQGQRVKYDPFRDNAVVDKHFKVVFEMEKPPVKDEVTGVKIALAGDTLPDDLARLRDFQIPHHISCYEYAGRYYAEVHYTFNHLSDEENAKSIKHPEVQEIMRKILTDTDPNIQHPDKS